MTKQLTEEERLDLALAACEQCLLEAMGTLADLKVKHPDVPSPSVGFNQRFALYRQLRFGSGENTRN